MSYQYKKPDKGASSGEWPILPEGDYSFSVTSCAFPKETVKEGGIRFDTIAIELLVERSNKVWDHRSAGIGAKGEFDMISPFLAAINREPARGEEKSPIFWARLEGARGRCHLIEDSYQGKVRNKVGYYHAPKPLGGSAPAPRSYSASELEQAATQARQRAEGRRPEEDEVPY